MKTTIGNSLICLLLAASCSGLYEPGVARRLAAMPLPDQNHPGFLNVEATVSLYYEKAGSEKPGTTLVYVHGGPAMPPANMPAALKRLNGPVVFYHQRGCGRSTRPIDRFEDRSYYANMKTLDSRLGLSAQLADIDRIRQSLGQERISLIGHSFGAFLAALYAAEFPERVDRLVLLAPAGVLRMPPPDGGLYTQVRERLPEEARPDYDAYLKRFFDYGSIFERSETELVALNEAFIPYYERATGKKAGPVAGTGGWAMHAVFFSMGQKADFRHLLQRVQAPTILIHGEDDLSPPESAADYRAISRLEFVRMAGAGHFLFEERPDEFIRIVNAFLNRDLTKEIPKNSTAPPSDRDND